MTKPNRFGPLPKIPEETLDQKRISSLEDRVHAAYGQARCKETDVLLIDALCEIARQLSRIADEISGK